MKIILSIFTMLIVIMSFSSCTQNEQNVKKVEPAEIKNITVQETHELQKNDKNIVILDVRTKDEFDDGHLNNAINIDVKQENFTSEIAKLDKNKTYVIYCRSGHRSGRGLNIMKENSFKRIYHMNDGFLQWQAKKLPVTK